MYETNKAYNKLKSIIRIIIVLLIANVFIYQTINSSARSIQSDIKVYCNSDSNTH